MLSFFAKFEYSVSIKELWVAATRNHRCWEPWWCTLLVTAIYLLKKKICTCETSCVVVENSFAVTQLTNFAECSVNLVTLIFNFISRSFRYYIHTALFVRTQLTFSEGHIAFHYICLHADARTVYMISDKDSTCVHSTNVLPLSPIFEDLDKPCTDLPDPTWNPSLRWSLDSSGNWMPFGKRMEFVYHQKCLNDFKIRHDSSETRITTMKPAVKKTKREVVPWRRSCLTQTMRCRETRAGWKKLRPPFVIEQMKYFLQEIHSPKWYNRGMNSRF